MLYNFLKNKKMTLGIYGAGGMGRDFYEQVNHFNLKEHKWKELYFIDDIISESNVYDKQVMRFKDFKKVFMPDKAEILIASGEPDIRKKIYKKVKEAGYPLTSFFHLNSYVSPNSVFGEGAVVLGHTFLYASSVKVGNNVVIMTGAGIGHDSIIGDHSVIAPSAVISGKCVLEQCSYIGTNATLREGVIVGENSVVGMGAVVVKDVPKNTVVVGNPANVIKEDIVSSVFKQYIIYSNR